MPDGDQSDFGARSPEVTPDPAVRPVPATSRPASGTPAGGEHAPAVVPPPERASVRPLLAAAVAYAIAVVALSWPLALHATTALVDPLKLPNAAGVWGRADLDLLVWILAWTAHALTTDPTQLFQANIFHPAPDTLASSENLLGLAPLSTPLFLLTRNPVLTYDVTVLAVVWLAALCTFVLVRAWSGSAGAAFLAGAAFALGPQLTGGFVRLHVSAVHFFPLVLLLAWRAASRPRALALAMLALVTALQMLAGIYVAFELVALLAAFAPALCWEARRNGRSVLPTLLALALGAAALAIVAPPYLRVRAAGTLPGLAEAVADVATTSPEPRLLWSWLVAELTLPGLALAGFGLLVGTGPLHLRLGLLLIAGVGLVLGAGTALPILPGGALPSVYEMLMWAVPGFAGMRSPARFLVLPLLSTTVLAGLGAARLVVVLGALLGDPGRRLGTAIACAAAVAVVVLRAPALPLPLAQVPLGGLAYAAHAWLAKQTARGPVIDVPVMNSSMDGTAVLATGRAMIGSTLHFLPLLNGYTGHPPAVSSLLLTLAQRLPDPTAFAAICALAAPRWIIVHEGLLSASEVSAWHTAESTLGLAKAAELGRDTIYRVDDACARTHPELELASPPRPGTTFAGTPLVLLERGTVQGRIDATIPSRLTAGSFTWLWAAVHNDGAIALPGMIGFTPGGVQIQARWWDAQTGRIVAFDESTPLGADLAPGASMRAQVGLAVPKRPGDYVVEIGLVQQGGGWLGDAAGGTPFLARGRVNVVPDSTT